MVKDELDDQDLSDDIKFRLWLARQLALMRASGYDLKTRVTGFSFGGKKLIVPCELTNKDSDVIIMPLGR